jgi:hypothetical protein
VWVAAFLGDCPAASVIVGDLNFAARYAYLGNNARPTCAQNIADFVMQLLE